MNIKLTLLNNDTIHTKINGTEKDIIKYYNDNNFLSSNKDTQIKEIEIESSTLGLTGCKSRTIIYIFEYDYKAECYLYQV